MTQEEGRYAAIDEQDLVLDGLSALELLATGLAEQHSYELSGAVAFVTEAIRARVKKAQELLEGAENVKTESKDV